MTRTEPANAPEEEALEHWVASDERNIRDHATFMRPTEAGRALMRELLIAAASTEQLDEIKRIIKSPTRS